VTTSWAAPLEMLHGATRALQRNGDFSIMPNATKTIKGALAALAVLGSLTWIVGVPAVASATPSVTAAQARATSTFRDVSTGFCLDSNTDRNAYTLGCNGGNFQNWIYAGSNTTSTIRDVSTGFCLDSNTAGQVYTLPCNGGNFQNWIISGSGGTVRDVSTGRCLDSNTDRKVYTLPCNGGNFQNWDHS
jgi:Ricin-type beta-trefoil lectin domain